MNALLPAYHTQVAQAVKAVFSWDDKFHRWQLRETNTVWCFQRVGPCTFSCNMGACIIRSEFLQFLLVAYQLNYRMLTPPRNITETLRVMSDASVYGNTLVSRICFDMWSLVNAGEFLAREPVLLATIINQVATFHYRVEGWMKNT